jgi:RNA polymerase sigma factor (TIGR02999 family)
MSDSHNSEARTSTSRSHDVREDATEGAHHMGSGGSAEDLLPIVYAELRAIAEARLRTLAPSATLQPTELLHEAYLRLANSQDGAFASRRHFVAAAALAMRSVLIDRARARNSVKRGGSFGRVELEDVPIAVDRPADEILAVDAALSKLESIDKRSARVVTLRFYLGLGEVEIAQAMGVTERTVRRDWTYARLWLQRELSANDRPDEGH